MKKPFYMTEEAVKVLDCSENPLVALSRKMQEQEKKKTEEYIKSHTNKKPKYLPTFIWNWMVKKVLKVNCIINWQRGKPL